MHFLPVTLLILSLTLSLSLDLSDTEVLTISRSDNHPEFTLTPSKKFALKFASNPTTGNDWYLQNTEEAKASGVLTFLNLVDNQGGEYVADKHELRMVGSGGSTYFLLKTNEVLGEVELKFEYKRIWETENFMEKTVVLKVGN